MSNYIYIYITVYIYICTYFKKILSQEGIRIFKGVDLGLELGTTRQICHWYWVPIGGSFYPQESGYPPVAELRLQHVTTRVTTTLVDTTSLVNGES